MHEHTSLHPRREQLLAFDQRRLAADESTQIERHLASCTTCSQLLQSIHSETSLELARTAEFTPAGDALQDVASGVAAPPDAVAVATPPSPATADNNSLAVLDQHPRYRIVEPIGRGGMGSVFRAEHRLMQRDVAIKVINPELVRHPLAVERFRREVQAAAKLNHPNIVAAHDAEQVGDLHLLVMEFVQGTDLATIVRQRGPLSVHEACDCIRQAAQGLAYAAEKKMVHRDIKPHNLMLTDDGRVRILDFGLAGFLDTSPDGLSGASPATQLTTEGSVMGTPDYMAPEQALDPHAADIRADLYSLGCTLYFLLTGSPPFPGGNALAKIAAHAKDAPPELSRLRPEVPPALSRLAGRLLAKNPADRIQTPSELAAELTPFLETGTAARRERNFARPALLTGLAVVLVMLGIFYVATDQGTMIVETDDEQVAVAVAASGIRIRDAVSGREFLVKPGKNRLRSGQYQISVRELPEGVMADASEFKLSRGEHARVRLQKMPRPPPPPPPPRTVEVANAFLAALDALDYGRAYDGMSSLAKQSIAKQQFEAGARTNGQTYGALTVRTLSGSFPVAPVPGLPPGRYYAVQFRSSFANLADQWETVMLNVDEDGEWRVNAHLISAAPPPLTRLD